MPQINALPWIRSSISEGLSHYQSYQRFTEFAHQQTERTGDRWVGMRRETYYRLYSEIRELRSRVPAAMQAPKDQIPGYGDVVASSRRHGQGYINWAIVYVRTPGSSEILPMHHAIRTDNPLTPEEVEQQATSSIQNAIQQAHGSLEGHVFLGTQYTGTERLQPLEE